MSWINLEGAASAHSITSSTLVGREQERRVLFELIEGGAALVTLTGAPGVGKTRLARELARQLTPHPTWPGGVWFADVASCRTRADVVDAVAAQLGAPPFDSSDPRRAHAVLVRALGAGGRALLILDNFEGAARSAAGVPEQWLDGVPTLQIVVTSRLRLGLAAEQLLEVPPLSEPEATRLFCARAARVRGGPPALDPELLGPLVRRLDCNPLALELAAGWTYVLSTSQLLERVSRGLEVLSRPGSSGRPGLSVRAALDASWGLMDAAERSALVQCAVFEAPFSVEAAEQVVIPVGEDPRSPLELVAALVDQSLLQPEREVRPAQPRRLFFFETVHLYAREKLATEPARMAIEARHAAAVLTQADWWLAPLRAGTSLPALEALRALQPELIALRARAGALPQGAQVRVTLALCELFNRRRRDQLPDLFAALDIDAIQEPESRARLYFHRAWSCFEAADHPGRRADLERARAIADEHQLPDIASRALLSLGHTYMNQGESAQALLATERGRELAALAGHRDLEAEHLSAQGMVHRRAGRYELARHQLSLALAIHTEAGAKPPGNLLNNLALVHLDEGALEQAAPLFERALASLEGDDAYDEAAIRANHAAALHLLGRWGEAAQRYAEAIQAFSRMGRELASYVSHLGLGILDLQRGELDDAARHLRAAEVLCEELGQPPDQARVAAFTAALHARRGEGGSARAHLARARSIVVRLGLEITQPLAGVIQRIGALLGPEEREREGPAPGVSFYERLADQLVGAWLSPPAAPPSAPQPPPAEAEWVVDGEGRWFQRGQGPRVMLLRRRALSLLLKALAHARVSSPGVALPVAALFEVGWPGERAQPQAASYRVYAALAGLKKLGLEGVLVNQYGGYLLDPAMPVHLAGPHPPPEGEPLPTRTPL